MVLRVFCSGQQAGVGAALQMWNTADRVVDHWDLLAMAAPREPNTGKINAGVGHRLLA